MGDAVDPNVSTFVKTFLQDESDNGNIIVVLYADPPVEGGEAGKVHIRFYYKLNDVKKIYDVGGPQALEKLAAGYVATVSSAASTSKVTTLKDLIRALSALQDQVSGMKLTQWDSKNTDNVTQFSLSAEQLSTLIPGFASSLSVMFAMPLYNLSAGMYVGMPPPMSHQWDYDIDHEAKMESQGRNFAFLVGLFGITILFTLLDLQVTRDSAGRNLDVIDKLRAADTDRNSRYQKFVELQDGSFTSVTRILAFVVGVTGFVVMWYHVLSTIRTVFLQNTREVQEPVVAQVTLKFLSG